MHRRRLYTAVPDGVNFSAFSAVTTDDVISVIGRLPDKSSAADPIPTPVFKTISNLVGPFIVELFNRSFVTGQFPTEFKHAFITPIVKKSGLDAADINSYRPISGLSVLSKTFERVALRQLTLYLDQHRLLPSLQSGFRPGHSTETATLRVLSDLLSAVDRGDFAALVLLDLSAAFDTVDHHILLERLWRSYGITDGAYNWLASYLTGRTQCVRRGASSAGSTTLRFGVPQGSVLGPLLFVLYAAQLQGLIEQHGLTPHLYADDTQIYGSCRPGDVGAFTNRLVNCVSDVASWMSSNRLQLNIDKTDLLWCTTSRRLHQLPHEALSLGGCDILPSHMVRNLGVLFDADLSMRSHIDVVVSRCFATLRQLRSIRHHITASVLQTLVTSLLLTRLDYCNGLLPGLPANQIRRLQSIQNAAARLIYNMRRSDHISNALMNLHWLRIQERIRFKMAVLVYRALNGLSPSYLHSFTPLSVSSRRSNLRSAASHRLLVPRSRLSTIGDRSFPIAGASVWNDLPVDIASSPSLNIFRSRLKTYLFAFSFPGAV